MSGDWHVLDNGVDPGAAPCSACTATRPGRTCGADCSRRPRPGWRVVAPDQLGMGFSERPDAPRTIAQRIADLGDLTDALGITGPVVTVGHDWGGIISLGWALAHRDAAARRRRSATRRWPNPPGTMVRR